jgi:hypothetical protein
VQIELRPRLALTRLAHIAGVLFTMLWVGVVWRGILLNSFPGNRDIIGMIKGVTEGLSLGMPYEFTSAMGTRMSYSALILNPVSVVQFLAGRPDALWTGFVVLIPLLGIGLLVLGRSARLSPITSLYGVVISALLVIVPSSMRVAFPEFGGAPFLLLYAIAPMVWGVLRSLADATTHRLSRQDAALQVVLLWSLSATGFAQAAVPWLVFVLALGEALTLWSASLRRAFEFLIRVALHGLLAVGVSSALFGSPILTILSSANSREGSFRGVTVDFEPWLIWNELGTSTGVRSIVALSTVVSLVLLWRSREKEHRRFASSAVSVLGCLLIYAFTFSLSLANDIEIGPRPNYLTTWLATPLLAVLLGNLASLSVSRIAVRARTVASWMSSDFSLTAVAAVIPLLLLTMFSLKNPSIAADGVRLTKRVEPPDVLGADPLLSSLREGRILIVDESEVLMGEAFHPTGVFALTQNRELPEGVTLLTAHQHSTTRWQHYVFESFGFNEFPAVALFLYARTFDVNLAHRIGATHVVSGKPLADPSLVLLKTDVSLGGTKRHLYVLAPVPSLPASSRISVSQESEPERATDRAQANNAVASEVVFVDRPALSLVTPTRSESQILRDRIELDFDSEGDSAVVLPIEFSACQYLVRTESSSGVSELLPLNGRFLGVLFTGKVTGEIRFRQVGPRALACQFSDYLQTRHIG